MEAEWEAQVKATLGEERYKAYTLGQDNNYQQARRITQRYGLADSVAAQACEMKKSAEAAAKRLRDDKSLDPAACQAALAAIQQETQQSLEATLGEKVFRTYRKHNGRWLEQLNPPPEE
jgi:enoyl-CoA hydratase/carnithine racemase